MPFSLGIERGMTLATNSQNEFAQPSPWPLLRVGCLVILVVLIGFACLIYVKAEQKRALDEFIIEGIKTTIPFHKKVLAHPDFIKGNFNTGFADRLNGQGP